MTWVDAVVHVIKYLPVVFLGAMEIAMLARAVCSWFQADGESGLYLFLVGITEPLIAPVAALFETFGWFEDSFLDVPFLVTMMIISLVETLLSFFA